MPDFGPHPDRDEAFLSMAQQAVCAQNRAGLERLVSRCMADAPHKDEPSRFLRLNADKVEGWLQLVDRSASFDRPIPDHLKGLTALDLSDAMDRLNAGARMIERDGLGAFIAQREAR